MPFLATLFLFRDALIEAVDASDPVYTAALRDVVRAVDRLIEVIIAK